MLWSHFIAYWTLHFKPSFLANGFMFFYLLTISHDMTTVITACPQKAKIKAPFKHDLFTTFRSPALATAWSLKRVSVPSTNPRSALPSSRNLWSSKWTLPTRKAHPPPRRTASTPSPSPFSQVTTSCAADSIWYKQITVSVGKGHWWWTWRLMNGRVMVWRHLQVE